MISASLNAQRARQWVSISAAPYSPYARIGAIVRLVRWVVLAIVIGLAIGVEGAAPREREVQNAPTPVLVCRDGKWVATTKPRGVALPGAREVLHPSEFVRSSAVARAAPPSC